MHRREHAFWTAVGLFGVAIAVLLPRFDAGAVCQGDKQDPHAIKTFMEKAMKGD
jgi:hypothetical protein